MATLDCSALCAPRLAQADTHVAGGRREGGAELSHDAALNFSWPSLLLYLRGSRGTPLTPRSSARVDLCRSRVVASWVLHWLIQLAHKALREVSQSARRP